MEPEEKITSKEQQILFFIEEYFRQRGYPPTVREIGKAVGLQSSCSVHYYLKKLEKNGFLRRDSSKPRAIEVLPHLLGINPDQDSVNIPVLNSLYLNGEKVCFDDVQFFIPFPRYLLGKGRFFALCWPGPTCIRPCLKEGDWVVVRHDDENAELNDGELVVAVGGEGILVGVLTQGGLAIELFPGENDGRKIRKRRFRIAGKVVGIWQNL